MRNNYYIGFIGVVLVALVLIFILNYFNVISLSKSYPKQFGFLPRMSSQKTSSSADTLKNEFTCPLDQSPCPEAETITKSIKDANFAGLGYNKIAAGTNVVAIISGEYQFREVSSTPSAQKAQQGEKDLLNFEIQNDNYLVSYLISGKVANLPDKGEIQENTNIAILSGGLRGKNNFDKMFNLIISVKNLKTGQYLQLKSADRGIEIAQ